MDKKLEYEYQLYLLKCLKCDYEEYIDNPIVDFEEFSKRLVEESLEK